MGAGALRSLVNAIAFLTRIRVPAQLKESDDLARSVPWFPVVGALIGLIIGAAAWGAGVVLAPLVAAALAVGLGTGLTGALHEDGLADTFDALGGSQTREHALEIMRDPRLGSFGTIALVTVTLIRVGSVAALFPGRLTLLVLPGAHALARSASVAVMCMMPAARGTGLGADHLRSLDRRHAVAGALAGVILATVLLGPATAVAIPAASLGAGLMAGWARARIGGTTGDVLGACALAAETAVLVVLSASPSRGLIGW